MRKNLFLLLLLFLAGCAGNTMVLNGEKIDILSPEEELELISTARATLAKSKRLTPNEQRITASKRTQRLPQSKHGRTPCRQWADRALNLLSHPLIRRALYYLLWVCLIIEEYLIRLLLEDG